MNKKDAGRQVVSAYDIAFESGRENGKQGILVNVGALEVLFNKTNALDIAWVKYKGNNAQLLCAYCAVRFFVRLLKADAG